jgi:anti-sigma regulatory factor (Ser/Thr protein kinase)
MTELAETAKLLTSELVTNVVVHTAASPVVAVASARGQLIVEVRDEASEWPADPGDPEAELGEAPGGRGLTLVAQLAADWGVRQIPDDGKGVWFALRPQQPPPYAADCDCSEPTHGAAAAS